MDILLENGINKETIEKIKNNNDEMLVSNIELESDNIILNLNYLKKIGIRRMDDLLIQRLDLFFIPNKKLKEEIERFNIEVLVNLINQDFNNLELIDIF